jgi:uncharacterized protein with von Willebrand factor type A (vWA) domain
MLIDFFLTVKKHRVPVTLRELLDLLKALEREVVFADWDAFYQLSRCILVKDEAHYDKFDRAFGEYFKGVQSIDLLAEEIPAEWLRKELEKRLSPEEKAQMETMGGLEKLLETLQERLQEQKKRHQGGNKWIGTGGTSPFGAYGDNPEGVRIGQAGNRNFSAVKVWEKREFRNFSEDEALSSRNMQLALRKLRRFARTGAAEELDIDDTIGATARNAGLLDLKLRPERRNAVKVLMFFDVGGSMDGHITEVQTLFSAVHAEFKHLKYFYFHNCVYEGVWEDNQRRNNVMSIHEIKRTYSKDYKCIFVGDATMGPYEITYPGGSVEHWNERPGSYWMDELLSHFSHSVWLNPQPLPVWRYHHSIQIIKQLMQERMYALTMEGLSEAMGALLKKS